MKINQYLSQATGISRREAESEVKKGNVTINGKVADFWQVVDLKKDIVKHNKKTVKLPEKETTIILNKPKGYLTVRKDPKGRKTVMNLLPKSLQDLKPVGRLDFNSEGLLILTNAGQKIFELTHPKFQKEKEYLLSFKDPIDERLITKFKRGIKLQEGIAKADKVEKIDGNRLSVIIHQGYNRQLRRMAEACNNKVVRLVRVRMGDVKLGNLKLGEIKNITL